LRGLTANMFSAAGVIDPWTYAWAPNGRARDMGLYEIAKDFTPTIFGGSGFLVAVKLWFDVRAARKAEKVAKATQEIDLIKIAREVAGATIADLRTQVGELQKQLTDVQTEFASFRKIHDTMIADKEAELALLRGKVRALEATVDAYERLLTANNIPHEKPSQPFFELRESELWPLPPPPGATP
jgi:hypothetical protein